MQYLRTQNFDVEKLRLTGTEDEGDLLVRDICSLRHTRFVIEAKRRRELDLAGWLREAQAERDNYDRHRAIDEPSGFLVVHKARGKGIGGSYVTTTLDEWIRGLG
jgi:hypothetical protein